MHRIRHALVFGFVLLISVPTKAQRGTDLDAGNKSNSSAASVRKSEAKPQRSVRKTIEEAIKALESYDCATVAVDFFNPVQRARIQDLDAYREQKQCSPDKKGNLDEILLALRLARLGQPEYKGISATISLEGAGLRVQKITLVKYLDNRWYFNESGSQ